MVHYIASDDKYRGSPYGNEGRLHLPGYRFVEITGSAGAPAPGYSTRTAT